MKKVAIVILNYNGGELLVDCINSFLKLDGVIFKLIIVDNGSTDGSIEMAEQLENNENLKIIHTGKNLGYTGGNNIGIEYALKNDFDYTMIVNSDTLVLNPTFVKEMVDYGENNPKAAIIGPKVFFRKETVVQNTICSYPFFFSTLTSWFSQRISSNKKIRSGDNIKEVDVLNGVCILLKRSFLKSVGGFDYDIFMYREDTDLALRAKKLGWQSVYLPVESILHLQKSEGYDFASMVNFLLKRNAVYVLKKHGRKFDAFAYAITSLILSFFRIFKSLNKKGEYFSFFRILANSYFVILFNKEIKNNRSFGPPYTTWKKLIQ